MGTVTMNLRPASEGDAKAQAIVFDRLYRDLSPYAAMRARFVRQFWEGADLLQHVCTRLLQPSLLSGFCSGSALRDYVKKSIDNKCRDIARSRAFQDQTRADGVAGSMEHAADQRDDIEARIDRECLRRAILMAAAADPDGFQLLRLSHVSSSADAALERGVSTRTVQRRTADFSRLVTAYHRRLQA